MHTALIVAVLATLVRAQNVQTVGEYYLDASVTQLSFGDLPCFYARYTPGHQLYHTYTWVSGGPIQWEIGGLYDSCPVSSVQDSGIISAASPIRYYNWTVFVVDCDRTITPNMCIRFTGDGVTNTTFRIGSPISIPSPPPPPGVATTGSTAAPTTAPSTATQAGDANPASKYTVF